MFFPGFLPAPIPITLDGNSRPKVSREGAENEKFLPLFTTMAFFKKLKIPYDTYCPSISEETIKKRTCATCGIYFSTATLQSKHRAVHKQEQKQQRQIKKVVVTRATESLVENLPGVDMHDKLEWLNNDDIDWINSGLNPLDEPDEGDDTFPLLVLPIENFIDSPWEITEDE